MANTTTDILRQGLAGIQTFDQPTSSEFHNYLCSLSSEERGCYEPCSLAISIAYDDACLDGWLYHPIQYCIPSPECALMRANKMTCPTQGTFEPRICDNGHYCPPGGKIQIPCPKGSFCPSGSRAPMICSKGAVCPPLSDKQLLTLPLGLLVSLDLALLALAGIGYLIRRWRRKRPAQYATLSSNDGIADDTALLRSSAVSRHDSVARRRRVFHPASIVPELSRPSSASPSPSETCVADNSSTPRRRASARVDNMDGFVGDDNESMYDEQIEDDFHNSPDLQRFVRSMTRTIETNSIGLAFDFENIGYMTKNGRLILREVTGSIARGSCWGVMGGSGAGKSTFINTLMGKLQTTSGTIRINGWQKDMSKYKKLIGYVPQDDIVFPELTVRENILHSARVRLPLMWRDEAVQDHVDSLIACLQLTHVQHARVGDARKPVISGGQRKRVNIGVELAAAPMAIFLDEPTSGLDATSAGSIMCLLRALSRVGVTVVAIVHQPREQIFDGFDHLLLLAQGQSVYSGPTDEAQAYFESLGYAFPQRGNPANTLIDITTGHGARYMVGMPGWPTGVQSLIVAWKGRGRSATTARDVPLVPLSEKASKRGRRSSNQSLQSTVEQEASLARTVKGRGASWPAQVYYGFNRAMLQQFRNSTSFFFEIGVGALAGLLIGLSAFASGGHLFQGIYHQPFTVLSSAVDYSSTPQLGLLGGLAIGLAASAPGFWVFGEEKLMYYRETASGHSRSAYYLGKLMSTILRIGLSSFHFTVFLNLLASPLMSFQHMYVANLAYFWCVYGLASIISMLVKREDGPLIAVLASLIIGVLGGVAPPLSTVKTWHLEWFWRISPGVWLTEAYFTKNLMPLGYLYDLRFAADSVGFTLGQFWLDVGVMLVIGLVYRVIAYLGLVFINKDKQR